MISEEELIEGCKQQKHAYFHALYTKYAMQLMSIAMRYSNTTFEAEDILQEAFIKIFTNIHSYAYSGSFEGWLKRIVVNTAIKQYHKNANYKISNLHDIGKATEVDCSDSLDKMSTDELIKLIQQLPEGYRLVFNLYEIEGYSHKEIAQLLNISEGTSKSQLHKAKQYLQKLLLKFDYSTYERRR
jgi:RNA polymerase sigma-70 factor (ECF subfamily)